MVLQPVLLPGLSRLPDGAIARGISIHEKWRQCSLQPGTARPQVPVLSLLGRFSDNDSCRICDLPLGISWFPSVTLLVVRYISFQPVFGLRSFHSCHKLACVEV